MLLLLSILQTSVLLVKPVLIGPLVHLVFGCLQPRSLSHHNLGFLGDLHFVEILEPILFLEESL